MHMHMHMPWSWYDMYIRMHMQMHICARAYMQRARICKCIYARARAGARTHARVCNQVAAPLDLVVDAAAMAQYRALFRVMLQMARTLRALRRMHNALHERAPLCGGGGGGGGGGGRIRPPPREVHLLQLHVHELTFFARHLHGYVGSHVCGACWRELQVALGAASSLSELRAAHAAYLASAAHHCLLGAADTPAASLIAAAFAHVLALQRALAAGGARVGLAHASRLQFAGITKGLAAAAHPISALYRT